MNGYNPYMNYLGNYQQQMQQRIQPIQQIQPMQQMVQTGLQGKSVESIDVVKAMDILLDGSINYFPLVDGSAIVTKQIQNDGTSRMRIYKPVEDKPVEKQFITIEEFDDLQKEIESLKKELKEIKSKSKKGE